MGKNQKEDNKKEEIKKTQELEQTKRISKGYYKPGTQGPK